MTTEPELSIDPAALAALQCGQPSVFGELDGLMISAERTGSGGLVVYVAENGTREPFAIFDAEELEELLPQTRDDVGVLIRFHGHSGKKCRPTGIKTNCNQRRCGNDGKNIDHVQCRGLFGRRLCWCRR